MRVVKHNVFRTHKCRSYFLEAATQTSIQRHRAAVDATTAVSRHYWHSGSPVLANYVTHLFVKNLRPSVPSGAKMLDWLYSKNGHLEVKPDMMTDDR